MEFRKHGISQPVGIIPGCSGLPVHESVLYHSPGGASATRYAQSGTVYAALLEKMKQQGTVKKQY